MILKQALGGVVAKAMTALVAGAFMLALAGEAEALPSKQRGFVGFGEFGGKYIIDDATVTEPEVEFSPYDCTCFSAGYLGDYFFGGSAGHAFSFDLSVTRRVAEVEYTSGEGDDYNDELTLVSLLPGYRYHFSGSDAGGYLGTGMLLRSLGELQFTLALTGGYEGKVGNSGLIMGIHFLLAPTLDFEKVEGLGGPMIAYSIGGAIN